MECQRNVKKMAKIFKEKRGKTIIISNKLFKKESAKMEKKEFSSVDYSITYCEHKNLMYPIENIRDKNYATY